MVRPVLRSQLTSSYAFDYLCFVFVSFFFQPRDLVAGITSFWLCGACEPAIGWCCSDHILYLHVACCVCVLRVHVCPKGVCYFCATVTIPWFMCVCVCIKQISLVTGFTGFWLRVRKSSFHSKSCCSLCGWVLAPSLNGRNHTTVRTTVPPDDPSEASMLC